MTTTAGQAPLTRLRVPVRPAQFETAASYLYRRCEANGVDPAYIRDIATARRRASKNPAEVGRVIHELGGPRPEHWTATHMRAMLGLPESRGSRDPYGRQADTRLACLSCTAGAPVATYTHVRFFICLKHGRWVGPEGGADGQRVGVSERVNRAAELRMRQLVASSRIDYVAIETASCLLRDWCRLSGQVPTRLRHETDSPTLLSDLDGRIALYPETVRLLTVMAGAGALVREGSSRPRTSQMQDRLRADLAWLPTDHWVVINGVQDWSRRLS